MSQTEGFKSYRIPKKANVKKDEAKLDTVSPLATVSPLVRTEHKTVKISRTRIERKKGEKTDSQDKSRKRKNPLSGQVQEHPQRKKRPSSNDPIELLDSIWREMEEDEVKDKTKRGNEGHEEAHSPTPGTSQSKLNRYDVMYGAKDDTILNQLMNKTGLMERLLGYKIKYAKMEMYPKMRLYAKLDECHGPEDSGVDYGVPPFDSTQVDTPIHKLSPATPPPPPPQTPPGMGPQTPPGSPPQAPTSRGDINTPCLTQSSKLSIKAQEYSQLESMSKELRDDEVLHSPSSGNTVQGLCDVLLPPPPPPPIFDSHLPSLPPSTLSKVPTVDLSKAFQSFDGSSISLATKIVNRKNSGPSMIINQRVVPSPTVPSLSLPPQAKLLTNLPCNTTVPPPSFNGLTPPRLPPPQVMPRIDLTRLPPPPVRPPPLMQTPIRPFQQKPAETIRPATVIPPPKQMNVNVPSYFPTTSKIMMPALGGRPPLITSVRPNRFSIPPPNRLPPMNVPPPMLSRPPPSAPLRPFPPVALNAPFMENQNPVRPRFPF